MFLLKDKLRQVMTKKHLDKNVIGTIALNAVRKYFGYTDNPLLLDGYVKFNKLFLKTTQQHIKITIFKEKQQLLSTINEQIAKIGFAQQINDIMFK
ncbi:MAG: hypothetical protein WCO66_00630 [Candidatus Absconditabacteria bacterium]